MKYTLVLVKDEVGLYRWISVDGNATLVNPWTVKFTKIGTKVTVEEPNDDLTAANDSAYLRSK